MDQHESEAPRPDTAAAALQAELELLKAERAELVDELRKMGFFKDTGHPRELVHAVRNVLNDFKILREVIRARRNPPR